MQIIMGGTDVKISRDASMECTGDNSLHLHGRVMRRRASPCIYHWVERKVDKGREEIREEKQDRGGRREHQCLKFSFQHF